MWPSYSPHGSAMLDHERGAAGATLECLQDGERDDVPAAFWFRDAIDPLEAAALDLCRGRVLDVGAGAGVHALRLQERGLAVTAIDIEPACVAVMRRRGVRDARVADLFHFEGGPFDTVLSVCNGLDKVGRLGDLPRFLDRMGRLIAPGGQLLADSFDLRVGADAAALSKMTAKTARGRYLGEIDMRFTYRGEIGAPFVALLVDPDTLGEVAAAAGWLCEILSRRDAHYLARLLPD